MYSDINSNKRKTWFLMSGFLIFIMLVGFVFSRALPEYSFILPIAVIFAVGSSWFSYFYSDKLVLAMSGAKLIEKVDNPYLYRMVENLAITSGLPTPKVYLIKDSAMNAFATGRDPEHAVVAVTSGILERLENEELEGVIAHEMAHIKNYDIRLQTIIVTLVGVVVLMSDFFLRSSIFGRRRSDDNNAGGIMLVVAIALSILAPIVASLITLGISRKREFLADASGALLTRYPEGLARALEKISGDPIPFKKASNATAHLFISNPFKKKHFFGKLFATHPPIGERVKQLRKMTV